MTYQAIPPGASIDLLAPNRERSLQTCSSYVDTTSCSMTASTAREMQPEPPKGSHRQSEILALGVRARNSSAAVAHAYRSLLTGYFAFAGCLAWPRTIMSIFSNGSQFITLNKIVMLARPDELRPSALSFFSYSALP